MKAITKIVCLVAVLLCSFSFDANAARGSRSKRPTRVTRSSSYHHRSTALRRLENVQRWLSRPRVSQTVLVKRRVIPKDSWPSWPLRGGATKFKEYKGARVRQTLNLKMPELNDSCNSFQHHYRLLCAPRQPHE